MKAHRKYKCEIINNGDGKKVANLKKRLLLDLQSAVDIFCNAVVLNNIQKIDNKVKVKTSTVSTKLDKQGYL